LHLSLEKPFETLYLVAKIHFIPLNFFHFPNPSINVDFPVPPSSPWFDRSDKI